MPQTMQRVVTAMADHDWLTSYRHIDAIDTALNRMSRRIKRENALVNSAEELAWNYDALEADFRVFFPDLIAFAAGQGLRESSSGALSHPAVQETSCR